MKILLTSLALALGVIPVLASAENGRYIVKFTEGRAQAALNALHAAGAQVALNLAPQNAVAVYIPEQALAGLSRNPSIEYIEDDVLRNPTALWSDSTVGGETTPYGVQMVQANLVNSSNLASRKICIIDSGYSQQHEDLRDTSDGGITANASDKGSGTWDQDSCGHGSHVAGTISGIAGNGKGVVGVAPGVQLHIVKVFGDDKLVDGGNCTWTYSSTLVDAVNKCQAAGANITSMSLGGARASRTEKSAFDSTYQAGMLHIAAAGNAGNHTTSYPAGYASVMSVAAVDADENIASFSQVNKDVEIAAPGVGVLSTVPWIDSNTLGYVGGSASGGHIEFAGRGTVSGTMVDGGQCTSAGSWTGAVVLCQRGTNTFLEKVNNVQTGQGVAAVIYNNVASDATCGDFLGTLGDGNSSTLPAISVSCAEGADAVAKAGNAGTVASTFTAPASGYEGWDGTSMATPHVSGVAALVWSCYSGASNAQIRDALRKSARDKGTAGRDSQYGYGIVQAKDAVNYLGGTNGFCTLY